MRTSPISPLCSQAVGATRATVVSDIILGTRGSSSESSKPLVKHEHRAKQQRGKVYEDEQIQGVCINGVLPRCTRTANQGRTPQREDQVDQNPCCSEVL